MTYASKRQADQLEQFDNAITSFIDLHQQNASKTNRRTIILFPGGFGSQLARAHRAYASDGDAFTYNTLWLNIPWIATGGVRHFRMHGEIDYDNHIAIAEGPLDLCGVFEPYGGFSQWCQQNGLDLLIFGWDWRRSSDLIVRFFVDQFMPHFRQRVKNLAPDPLADVTLIGHSFGGMVVKLILHESVPEVARAITVGTPFYGSGGQLHRYFEGQPELNGFYSKGELAEIIASLAGGYFLLFLDHATYVRDRVALNGDPNYPLPAYPSRDLDTGQPADPYNPNTNGELVRYPAYFSRSALDEAKTLFGRLVANLPGHVNQRFFNIRGIQHDGTSPLADTIVSQSWDWIRPDFNPNLDQTPVEESNADWGAGDGTVPAWSARLVSAPPGNVFDIAGDHVTMMDNDAIRARIFKILFAGTKMPRMVPSPTATNVASEEELQAMQKELRAVVEKAQSTEAAQKAIREHLASKDKAKLRELAIRLMTNIVRGPSKPPRKRGN
jgi:hypothetical protein